MFLLLAAIVLASISLFAGRASRQNASALVYERSGAGLQGILRGLHEAAVHGDSGANSVIARELKGFDDLVSANAELHAETGGAWPVIDRKIMALVRRQANVAEGDRALIDLAPLTADIERMEAGLVATAAVKRRDAEAAESRVQMAIIAAGVLMTLGTMGFFTFMVRGVTTRKVLDAVRASETQLRDITDAVPAIIMYFDAQRRVRFHNQPTEEALGLPHRKIADHTMLEVFGEELYKTLSPRVDEVLAGYPVRFEHVLVDPRGEPRDYDVNYFPRYRQGREGQSVIGFYALISDISAVKRIDRMKTEFISIVSHELRTPLTSIRGSLGLIAGGMAGVLPDAAKKLVDIAKNNCERLVRLINDILDSEKIESGKMIFDLKVIELAPLVAASIAANEGLATPNGISIRLLAASDGLRVRADSDGVTQVVTNLLSNAVKFSPDGASVDVAITRADGRVRVEVRDRGPGIPVDFRARIFQKFSQADSSDSRQKSGSGLGLNISKAIVERLGGTIGFTTELGAGTAFHFELPEWRDAPARVAEAAGADPLKRPRVLVCEDDPDIALLIGKMLDTAGFDTDLAYTAARARELAQANPYDAMTVDLRLPDQDGVALIRALREGERTRELPIVVVSAISGEGRVRLDSETLSVSDWLGKPVDANHLVVSVRDAAAGKYRDMPRVLHVESDPDIQRVTAAIARDLAAFDCAATVQDARARLLVCKYDLVLLEPNLAEGDASGWNLIADIDALEPPPPVVVFSASEADRADRRRVACALVKARTSNEELLGALERNLRCGPQRGGADRRSSSSFR